MSSPFNYTHTGSQLPLLEIAIFNATSAVLAYTSAADRLELCAEGSFSNGGTTPTLTTLNKVISSLQRVQADATKIPPRQKIPIYAMIRPRGGNFLYSAEEFEFMKEELVTLKNADFENKSSSNNDNDNDNQAFGKVSGFVFGILTQDGKVDRARNEELVRLAAPLPCTFHRAFDEVITSFEHRSESHKTSSVSSSNNHKASLLPEGLIHELEAVINAGFTSILTSGGTGKSALEGVRQISALTSVADGRISIIAGGGVRSTNVRELRSGSPGTPFMHSSAIVGSSADSDVDVDVASPEEVRALKRELTLPLSA